MPQELSARAQEILRSVVTHYILTGEPVGSRTIAKMNWEGLSPASIRNVMADLEEMGYLTHPHTSAGRIPTDLGYRHYVNALPPAGRVMPQDQAMIDKFAEATGDHQWIHVDVERAKKEMPGGKTIAHGYLTLSLLPRLVPQLLKVEKRKRGINYGSNKIRFTNTVPAGSRVRLKQTIKNVEDVEGNGVRITSEMVMEVEGQERPALIAEVLGIQYA